MYPTQINICTTGIANRYVSVRVPRQVAEDKCGYLEDRRPASNCDPYDVTDALVRTLCLSNKAAPANANELEEVVPNREATE